MFEKRIVFSLPAMEGITPRANLIYKTAEDGPLLADLYLPPAATALSPVVIFIHGGVPDGIPSKPKDWGVFVSWGQLIAASQMAGVTFNHSMRWNNGFVPGSIEKATDDLAALIRISAITRRSCASMRRESASLRSPPEVRCSPRQCLKDTRESDVSPRFMHTLVTRRSMARRMRLATPRLAH